WSEFARSDDVHIPPEPIFWVVREVHACGKGIAEVSTGGIACLGDRNTVVEGRSARGELREEPAILQLIVQYNRVTGRIGAIGDRKTRPEGTSIYGSHQQVARLIIHSKDEIDYLDKIVRADFTVRIRWIHPEPEDVKVVLS